MTRALACALAAAAVVVGCGDKPPPPAAATKDPFAITAGPELLARIKIGEARETEVRETLRVPGRVEVDEARVARVGSPVTGRVSGLEVREGDDVKRGQILATLTSTELSNTQLEYLKAYSQKLLADRAAGRAKQLLDADVIGAAELQRRQAEAAQADADLNAASDRLKVLGMSDRAVARLAATRRVDSTSQIVSSIAGTVIDRKVSPGQVVQPADTVYVVADLSEVWIVADVPEAIAGSVRAGQMVEVEIPAIPDRRIRGAALVRERRREPGDAHGPGADGRPEPGARVQAGDARDGADPGTAAEEARGPVGRDGARREPRLRVHPDRAQTRSCCGR